MLQPNKKNDIRILKATLDHAPMIIEVADDVFGKGYMTDGLQEKIMDPGAVFDVAFNEDGEFLGYCYTNVVEAQQVAPLYRIMSLPREIAKDQPLGIIKTMAVVKHHQKQGVGTRLAANALQAIANRNIQACVTLAWESKDGINLSGIVKGLDFDIHEKLPDFWYEDSLKKRYECPDCGKPPCRCSAIVYFKLLRPQSEAAHAPREKTGKHQLKQIGKTTTYLGKVWWEYEP